MRFKKKKLSPWAVTTIMDVEGQHHLCHPGHKEGGWRCHWCPGQEEWSIFYLFVVVE
jgi:hypothetical protein